MTTLKFCGLRDATSAAAAADAGADLLGFVFVPGARRRITPGEARSIIDEYRRDRGKSGPRLVGLFANQSAREVEHTVRYCGLDLAQLCGDEPPQYWQALAVPIIKQVKVREHGGREQTIADVLGRVAEVADRGHIPLLDRYVAGAHGGSGHSFDWSIAAEIARHNEFLLAGGLTRENVAQAIEVASPWGVDVSSGVETDGTKDTAKIAAFAKAVKRADAHAR
jgi:phosphoribosylanthranilate isomerase